MQFSLRPLLCLCAAVLASACSFSGHDAAYYEKRAAKVDSRYAPLEAQHKEDAAWYFAWGEELGHITWRASMDKFPSSVSGILARACEHYDKASGLAPENARYALMLAQCRIELAENRYGESRGKDDPALREARAAVARAKALAPGNTLLAELWAEALIELASDKKVPAEEALALLREADGVYAGILPYAPMSDGRATVPYFIRWRGKVAVLTACRQRNRAEAEAVLAAGNRYYEQSCGMADPLQCLSDWSEALDPEGKPLADPSFAGVLLRAKLHPLLIGAGETDDPYLSFYRDMALCETYTRLIEFSPDPQEREEVLREGNSHCGRALRGADEIYQPRLREAAKRIEAGLAALSGFPPRGR